MPAKNRSESRKTCCVTRRAYESSFSLHAIEISLLFQQIPYEVKISVPQPYDVIKKYPVKVKEVQKYTVEVPKPYTVEKKVPYEVKVPVEKPYPVKVFVPEPYEVIKKVNELLINFAN